MELKIRTETSADFRASENIVREAFWNLYCPGCNEHLIVHNMREHPDYIPELAFVIERDGEPVGCIFHTRSTVVSEDGNAQPVVTFGPVAILPRYHRQGIGRRLITHSIGEAKAMGFSALVIGGYPYHYRPYGFQGAKKFGISMPDGLFYTGLLALPLRENGLKGVSGRIRFSDVFETDPTQLEEFDARFDPKEKLVLPCQEEFLRASSEKDERNF